MECDQPPIIQLHRNLSNLGMHTCTYVCKIHVVVSILQSKRIAILYTNMKNIFQRCRRIQGWQCQNHTNQIYGWQCADDYTNNPIPTPSLFVYPHKAVSSNLTTKLINIYVLFKKDVGMGLLVQSSPHCHPYIQFVWFLALLSLHPSTFLENGFHTYCTCLCTFLLYHSTIREVVLFYVKHQHLYYAFMTMCWLSPSKLRLQLLGKYCWVKKHCKGIDKCLAREQPKILALGSLEDFCMYTHTMGESAPSLPSLEEFTESL